MIRVLAGLAIFGLLGGCGGQSNRSPATPKATQGAATVDAVSQRIGTEYMGPIKSCYEKTLATTPGLAGRIEFTIAVDENGAVTEGRASGLHPEVDACVQALMPAWTFDRPPHGPASYVSYVVLRPGEDMSASAP